MKWSIEGENRMVYEVVHVIGFSTDISIMDGKGKVRVNYDIEVTMMRNKCKNQVANLMIWSRVTRRKT